MFYTLQGEGAHAGCAAFFVRLAGCDVGCRWCDSRTSWGAGQLVGADEIARQASGYPTDIVVVTGGEPTMHNLDELCDELHEKGLEIHLETSGTHPFSGDFDWICLSPKRHRPPLDEFWGRADELKIVVETAEDLPWAEDCAAKIAAKRETAKAETVKTQTEACGGRSIGTKIQPSAAGGFGLRVAKATQNVDTVRFTLQPEWGSRAEITPILVEYIKQNPRWRLSLQAHKYIDIP